MRFNFNKYLAITAIFLCFSNISFASSVRSCATSGSYDYGDAIGYGQACHDTNAWQQLGKAKIKNPDYDSNIPKGRDNKKFLNQALQGDSGSTNDNTSQNGGWNAETSQNEVDKGDNGVQWRIKDENGDWPTKLNGKPLWSRDELQQGQTVQFQFIVQRSDEGNHEFDQLKVWVDWNGDKEFNNDAMGSSESEVLFDDKWYKNEDADGQVNANTTDKVNYNTDLKTQNNSDTLRYYNKTIEIPLDAVIGDTWIRARIICENSLHAADKRDNVFLATGYYHQGEVEDYKVKINQVPEPTTLLVFGSALFGLLLNRKKST
jgi:hypothetical protein